MQEAKPGHGALGGTVLRGKDGSVYFIRDEMLRALQVQGDGLKRLEEALKTTRSEVEHYDPKGGSAPHAAPVTTVQAYVKGSLLREDPRNVSQKLPETAPLVASTIMCPWFC